MILLVIDVVRINPNELGRLTIRRFGISIQYSDIQYHTRKSY